MRPGPIGRDASERAEEGRRVLLLGEPSDGADDLGVERKAELVASCLARTGREGEPFRLDAAADARVLVAPADAMAKAERLVRLGHDHEPVAPPRKQALGADHRPGKATAVVVEAPSVHRVHRCQRVCCPCCEAADGSGLARVGVDDVGLDPHEETVHGPDRTRVAERADRASHRRYDVDLDA
jgi:hypothetical protein